MEGNVGALEFEHVVISVAVYSATQPHIVAPPRYSSGQSTSVLLATNRLLLSLFGMFSIYRVARNLLRGFVGVLLVVGKDFGEIPVVGDDQRKWNSTTLF